MEQVQFDPRIKAQIKDALFEFLYIPVRKAFKHRLDTIIIRNTFINKNAEKSFHYRGTQYHCEDGVHPPRKWNKLHPDLKASMDEYLADVNQVYNNEVPLVIGCITQVLNSSNCFADYLRIFPDSTHAGLKDFTSSGATQLSNERVEELKLHHQKSINLMKARMVTNLLL